MLLKRRPLVILGLIAAVVGYAAYRLSTHDTPKAQGPLVYLSDAGLSALRDDFNRASDGTRIILLLAPT